MHIVYPEPMTWIDGAVEQSALPTTRDLYDPNTSEPLQRQRSSSPAQVDRAIAAASDAHDRGDWRGRTPEERAETLRTFARLVDGISEHVAQLDALNSGVPISVTRQLAGSMAATVHAAADRLLAAGDVRALDAGGRRVTLRAQPWGAAALILPWNVPAAMAIKKLSFALAAGAPAVVKPSSASPWSAHLIVQAAHDAGFPPGCVNLVIGGGDVGEQLVGDPRIRAISMTGSTSTGKSVAARASANLTRLQLELGSNNPAIVRTDADISATADSIVSGAMKFSGQWCEAPRRVLVARPAMDDIVEAMTASLRDLPLGSSLAADTRIGPVAFRARQKELHAQRDAIAAAGARVIETTTPPENGWFVAPTILIGRSADAPGEIFGPMILVEPVDDDEHAIKIANSGAHGLAGYVYSEDLDAAYALGARIVAGEVKVNGSSVLDLAPDSSQSFFADSGIGGHGDAGVLEFFRGSQVIGTDAPGTPL